MKRRIFEIQEERGEISTKAYIDNNYCYLETSIKDKYGQAMMAYFYNMLCGKNTKSLALTKKPELYYDNMKESYVLKMSVVPTGECFANNYESFRKNYKNMIKDEISHLDKCLKKG